MDFKAWQEAMSSYVIKTGKIEEDYLL